MIVILGAGGHARSLIDCLRAKGESTIHGILSNDPEQWGTDILDISILGSDDLLSELHAAGVTHFVIGVGSVGDTRLRQRLADLGLVYNYQPFTVIHPSAVCASSAQLGAGTQVFAQAVINATSTIGQHVVINTGAIVEHDCQISDHVFIAPRACLCGNVIVERGAHIGAGAIIRENITIGAQAIVGAGAVVVKPVAADSVVVGVPARELLNK